MISGAPRAFALSLVAFAALIVFVMYAFFRANLDLKADLIASLKDERDRMSAEIATLKSTPVQKDEGRNHEEFERTKLETISRHAYLNETVEIDGKLFDHCVFKNSTLTYHGKGPVTFLESKFEGSILLQTDHAAAHTFYRMVEHFRSLPNMPYFSVAEKDFKTGNMHILSKGKTTHVPPVESPKLEER